MIVTPTTLQTVQAVAPALLAIFLFGAGLGMFVSGLALRIEFPYSYRLSLLCNLIGLLCLFGILVSQEIGLAAEFETNTPRGTPLSTHVVAFISCFMSLTALWAGRDSFG